MQTYTQELVTPEMVRAHLFPSRDIRLPRCFMRWSFENPLQEPDKFWHSRLVGAVVGRHGDSSGGLLPVSQLAVLVELCRYRLRIVPSYGSTDTAPGNHRFFPLSYYWDLVDDVGDAILWDVRTLWHHGAQKAGRTLVAHWAAKAHRPGRGIELSQYMANLWGLFQLSDTKPADGANA